VKTHPVECRECGSLQLSDLSCCIECGACNLRPAFPGVGSFQFQGEDLDVEPDLVELVDHSFRQMSIDEVRDRLLWNRGVE
jgi:hypothetical protein